MQVYYLLFLDQMANSIDTPLGLACGRNRSIQCLQSLLAGGAHIDFRGKDGLTPMHRAAIGGNGMAINVSQYIVYFNLHVVVYYRFDS